MCFAVKRAREGERALDPTSDGPNVSTNGSKEEKHSPNPAPYKRAGSHAADVEEPKHLLQVSCVMWHLNAW
jgi:hypothetical protein